MFKNLFKGSHTRNEYNKKENDESYEDTKKQMANSWVVDINKAGSVNNTFEGIYFYRIYYSSILSAKVVC